MLKNYIKIARRNLQRNKAYAAISVTGLALGIACGILIFTLISYHLSYDNFHQHPDRIYRMYTEWLDDTESEVSAVPQPLGREFRSNFTLAEKTARIVNYNSVLVTINTNSQVKKFNEEAGVAFTEPAYFEILNFPLANGEKKQLLTRLNEALVTEKIAKKYFGTENPVGKVLRLNNKISFTISGVLKDLPDNTDRRQEIYVSYGNIIEFTGDKNLETNWGGVYSGSEAFVLLKSGVSKTQVDHAMAQIVKKNYKGRDLKTWYFRLQPLSDIHFNAKLGAFASMKSLWALFFIGLFLIITACVNFVNLATAQALNRSKEIGVRKVLGSLPFQLFWQFIAETAIITVVAVALAIGLSYLALPAINDLFESQMHFQLLPLSGFIILITLIVVFLSGSYPGLVLARFQPIQALKNKLSQKNVGGFSLRRVLVITQFTISQVLIIGTIVVVSQLNYSKNADLGFSKDAIVLLPIPKVDKAKENTMFNRLKEISGVEKVSLCYAPPAAESNNLTDPVFNHRAESEHWGINLKPADANFLSTFDLKLVAGRNFFPSDTTREFLVNETFVKKLNLKPADVIGKSLAINGKSTTAPIVGVVKDFYNYSFHTEISPICIMPNYKGYETCAIKINMRDAKSSLAAFEKIWNETYPEELYSYQFLDKNIAKFYQQDNIMLSLIEAFAAIAIVIGCLGLYGMVSFMAVRKTKEIGVRKVLGAGIPQILWLFGKEFTFLLTIAFVIAAPIAWLTMSHYLDDFIYKITLGPGIFASSIGFTFLVAGLTVGYRSIAASLTNPVKSLRSE